MKKIESILHEERRYTPSAEFVKHANINPEHYKKLIQSAQDDPERYWSDLAKQELTWFEDFETVVNKKNPPFYKWFEDGKLNISYNCLDRHLKDRANKTAIIFEGEPGDTSTLTYKELHTAVCKAANLLKELDIQKGDVVCIYMPLCPESLIAMLACTRIGAIHSVVFAGFSPHALRDRITDGKAKLIVTADGLFRKGSLVPLLGYVEEALSGLVASNTNPVKTVLYYERLGEKYKTQLEIVETVIKTKLKSISLLKWDQQADQAYFAREDYCEPEPLDSNDISFILYTSGSTGKPKGIQHGTAGYLLWAHLTCKWVFDLKDSDIYWCTADIGWITGHSYVCYGPLSNGATCFIYEGAPNFPDESRFWSLIEKYKITVFYTAPTAIRTFMQWGLEHIKKHDLNSLRLLGSVGEPINPEVWIWFYENIGHAKCPIVDTWWQTETGGIMITTIPGVHEMRPGSAGLPLPGIDMDVDENNNSLLHCKSPWPSMLQTIYGDNARYIQNYWSQIPGAYTAGDGAYKSENGYITIVGRIDDVINVSGHRLGTAEIESALISHPLIVEAAVVAVPHEIKGEGIVAYVVLSESPSSRDRSRPVPIRDLEQEFKNHVVKMIGAIAKPEKIIVCPGLPKTRSGKIMRRLLKDLAQGKEPTGDLSTVDDISALTRWLKR